MLECKGGDTKGEYNSSKKNKPLKISDSKIGSVIPPGFEPGTHSLEADLK